MLDLENKNINFEETEANFIYHRSLRIFGSFPMVDLEKEKLHQEKGKWNPLTFDRREYSNERGKADFCTSSFFLVLPGTSLQFCTSEVRFPPLVSIIIEDKSRKWKNSIQEREAKFTHHRSMRVFWSLSMIDLTKAEIHLLGAKEVDFTHSQSRRLFDSLLTINLENKEIPSAERQVNSKHFRSTTVF